MSNSFPFTHALLWLGTICLLTVFALAGITKLRDLDRARDGLLGFGMPERWSLPMTIALALAELLIAALLVWPSTQSVGAVSALGLLAVFTLALAWQLLRGRRPACACFGALTESTISWKSVGRNLLLMTVAGGLIAVSAAGAVFMPLDATSLPIILALAWTTTSAIWLLLLTRQNGRLLLRIEQLERVERAASQGKPLAAKPTGPLHVGDAVPELHLNEARGRPFDLSSLRGMPVLVLFLDAACSHCRPLLAHLRGAQLANASAAIVVISENASVSQDLPGDVIVLVDPGWTTPVLFGARGTPSAVSIDADGAIAQPAAHGGSAVRAAIDQVFPKEVRHELAPV